MYQISATFNPRRPGVIAYAGMTTAMIFSLLSMSCFMMSLLYVESKEILAQLTMFQAMVSSSGGIAGWALRKFYVFLIFP